MCFLFYRIVHPSVVLMRPLDVTSAAHSMFFSGKFTMPNITLQSKDKMRSISGNGNFINAPFNRFDLFYLFRWTAHVLKSNRFSFLTVATNTTKKDVELTQVQNKNCIGTVIILVISLFFIAYPGPRYPQVNQEICIIPAHGRIQLIATGYIWFKYSKKVFHVHGPLCLYFTNSHSKRAPLANPNGAKHSRCMFYI